MANYFVFTNAVTGLIKMINLALLPIDHIFPLPQPIAPTPSPYGIYKMVHYRKYLWVIENGAEHKIADQ